MFSFSSKKDLLSQWRAYGQYSIEFDKQLLEKQIGKIDPCIYEKNDKIDYAKKRIYKVFESIEKEINTGNNLFSVDELIKIVSDLACFKHNNFKEENEYRRISQAGSHYTYSSESKMKYCNKKKYRVKGAMLVPYIEVKISIDCIKSIMVGPIKNQELAYSSLLEFVNEAILRNDSLNDYELPILRSETPYREF
ncbi:MAG: DUF2971 domain-containing protein [Proteobacteria bacterium]|nr:DUF2971 domain-containing protein [Pseudomonadota bacterium]MBU1387701.1 DUF2971 domain-containing protein [Pseudomonadota bacterium]MBU1541793.1 DUF2971 domain-containing protein [Pseudomonadota bacterium]MBU2480738.1 DUF2971 domain-containing protein [Pseudomonadota bacterium]